MTHIFLKLSLVLPKVVPRVSVECLSDYQTFFFLAFDFFKPLDLVSLERPETTFCLSLSAAIKVKREKNFPISTYPAFGGDPVEF